MGGVVEYAKCLNPNKTLGTEENLQNYLNFIRSPAAEDIDILVFPEGTLNNRDTAVFVPDPTDNINPCTGTETDWSHLLEQISCAARDQKTYIVINIIEKSICPDKEQIKLNDTRPCDESKINLYNSNVVFDRSGNIISKYHKYNLFGEPGIVRPIQPESVSFETDFGVTFGHFICFDLLFKKPALGLIDQGVTDFVYPTWWFSELPFLSAAQIQQSWAYKHNVNFLAAGSSIPMIGSTGSGIYHARTGALTFAMHHNATS